MKAKILSLIIISLFFNSCALKNYSLTGVYIKKYKYKDDGTTLILNKDSTFFLGYGYISDCKGTWRHIKDTIYLQCIDEGILDCITGGYMRQREHKILIINKRKLQKDNEFIAGKKFILRKARKMKERYPSRSGYYHIK